MALEAGIPLVISFNLGDHFFLGASTGIAILDFSRADWSFVMPLGVLAGFTVEGSKGPLLDVGGSFGFPYFLTPGLSNAISTEFWSVGLTGRLYLPFG